MNEIILGLIQLGYLWSDLIIFREKTFLNNLVSGCWDFLLFDLTFLLLRLRSNPVMKHHAVNILDWCFCNPTLPNTEVEE